MTTSEPRTVPGVIWFGMDEMRNDGNTLGFRDFRPNPAAPESEPTEAVEVEAPKVLAPPAPEEIHPSALASSDSQEQSPEEPEVTTPLAATNQTEAKPELEATGTPTTTPTTTHPDLDF